MMKDLLDDTAGGTAIEYGLIVALIVIAIMVSLFGFSGEAQELWAAVDTKVTDAIGNGPQTPPRD
jgi:pilus assembly protein Flp/PilA